ncbi:hypothetical protein Dimus_000187 [Dionaea muscipula]
MGKRGRPRKIAGNGRGSVAVQVASLGDSLVAKEQSVSDGGKSVNPWDRVLSTMALSGRDDGIDGIGAARESNLIEVPVGEETGVQQDVRAQALELKDPVFVASVGRGQGLQGGQREGVKPYLRAVQQGSEMGIEEIAPRIEAGNRDTVQCRRVVKSQARGRTDGVELHLMTDKGENPRLVQQGKGQQKEGLLPARGKHAMDGIWVVAKGGPKPEMVVRGGIEVSKLSRFQILQDDKLMEMEGSSAIEDVARSGHEEGNHAESSEPVEVGERDRQRGVFELQRLLQAEESQSQTVAKADWMKLADRNTAYFYSVIKSRRRKQRVVSLCDQQGTRWTEMQDIQRLVLEFYEGLLGASCGSREELDRVCIEDGRTLTGEQQHYLAEETHDHLFCGCGVSREIMQGGMREVKLGPRRYEWMYLKEWILKVARVVAEVWGLIGMWVEEVAGILALMHLEFFFKGLGYEISALRAGRAVVADCRPCAVLLMARECGVIC